MLKHEKIVLEVLRGRVDHDHDSLIRAIRKWVKEAVATEREECAKECDGMAGHYKALRDKGPKEYSKHVDVDTLRMFASEGCAAAIRERK